MLVIQVPKSQAPTSIEASNFNIQYSKLAMRLIEIWILIPPSRDWSLDVGIWSFELWPRHLRMLRALRNRDYKGRETGFTPRARM
jgi:hypothetical protein